MALIVTTGTFPFFAAGVGNSTECGFYVLKEYLKANGWVVRGSSDGTSWSWNTTPHGAATDYITSGATFYTNTLSTIWLVLESPHFNAADRVQILFGSIAGTAYDVFAVNPACDWVATSTTRPTSAAYSVPYAATGTGTTAAGTCRYHICYDTVTDEFSMIGTQSGVPTTTMFWFFLHKIVVAGPDVAAKYVFGVQANNSYAFDSGTGASNLGGDDFISGYFASATGSIVAAYSTTAVGFVGITNPSVGAGVGGTTKTRVAPGMAITNSGAFSDIPVLYFSCSTHGAFRFIGVGSDFIRRGGQQHTVLDIIGNSPTDYARVCLNNVTIAWDGVTPVSV